ncbi:MAG TPA: rod shape-determining protein RodA [Firmicutes bacterium]|nr:rod shape-determining protein RodA [Candidatus Fermentithermobacillaceae bacterium]
MDILSIPLIDSATHGSGDHYYAKKQAALVAVSLVVLFLGTAIDHRDLVEMSPWLYGLNGVLLVLVLLVGRTVGGSTRWLSLGFFDLQPSETAKIVMILFCAKILGRMEEPPNGIFALGAYYAWAVVPMLLIMRQPDLGTAMVLVALCTGALYFSGTSGKTIAKLALAGVLAIAIVLCLHFYAGMPLPLEDYQLKRLLTLFNPNADPLGTGYQVLQSKIAIGSGSVWGKGLGQGTQNRLDFIPEQHTDFIFSVVGEELGFVRGLGVLALYFLICYRCLIAAVTSTDRVGTIVAGGVLSMFVFQLAVNIGMTMGIMPVTGIPLPFLSHGGTALLTNSFAVGMVLNVGWQKHKILF